MVIEFPPERHLLTELMRQLHREAENQLEPLTMGDVVSIGDARDAINAAMGVVLPSQPADDQTPFRTRAV